MFRSLLRARDRECFGAASAMILWECVWVSMGEWRMVSEVLLRVEGSDRCRGECIRGENLEKTVVRVSGNVNEVSASWLFGSQVPR